MSNANFVAINTSFVRLEVPFKIDTDEKCYAILSALRQVFAFGHSQ